MGVIKRVLSVILSATLILLCFSSCQADEGAVITVENSADIPLGIFTYFLNTAYYGDNAGDSGSVEEATSLCLEYVAVNTKFRELGEKLTEDEKAAVSKETNALWRMYGDYLTEIGVKKEDFFKIKQYERFKEKLRFRLYDKNGEKPVDEEYIKKYFTGNFIGVKYFYEELYTPASESAYNSMTDLEKRNYDARKSAALKRYDYISEVANYVNSGVYSMDEAFMAVTGEVSADISVQATVVSKKGGADFTPEYVEKMMRQAPGSAFMITNSEKSSVYLIERVDLLDSKYDFYEEYRDECLRAVTENLFVSDVNGWIESYSATRRLPLADKALETIKSVDRSAYAGTEQYAFKPFTLN